MTTIPPETVEHAAEALLDQLNLQAMRLPGSLDRRVIEAGTALRGALSLRKIALFDLPAPPSAEEGWVLDDEIRAIRRLGWTVAVHNDYRLDGRNHTYWLFTKGEQCRQAECPVEDEAKALSALRKRLAALPSPPAEEAKP